MKKQGMCCRDGKIFDRLSRPCFVFAASLFLLFEAACYFIVAPVKAEEKFCVGSPGIKNPAYWKKPLDMYRAWQRGKISSEEYAKWMGAYYTDPRSLELMTGAIVSKKENVRLPLEVLGDKFAAKYGKQRIVTGKILNKKYFKKPFKGNCCEWYRLKKLQKMKYQWVVRGTVYKYDFIKGLVDINTLKNLGLNKPSLLTLGFTTAHGGVEYINETKKISKATGKLLSKGLYILETAIEAYEAWENYESLKKGTAELVEAPGIKIPFIGASAAYSIHFKGVTYLPTDICLEPLGDSLIETVTEKIGQYPCWASIQDVHKGIKNGCKGGEKRKKPKKEKHEKIVELGPPGEIKKKDSKTRKAYEAKLPKPTTWSGYWGEQFPDRCQQKAYDKYIKKNCRKISTEATSLYEKVAEKAKSANKVFYSYQYYKEQLAKLDKKYQSYLKLKKQEKAKYEIYQKALKGCKKARMEYDKAHNEIVKLRAPKNLRGEDLEQWFEAKLRALNLKLKQKEQEKDKACIDNLYKAETDYKNINKKVNEAKWISRKWNRSRRLSDSLYKDWKKKFSEYQKELQKYKKLTGPDADKCKKEAKTYAAKKFCPDLTVDTIPIIFTKPHGISAVVTREIEGVHAPPGGGEEIEVEVVQVLPGEGYNPFSPRDSLGHGLRQPTAKRGRGLGTPEQVSKKPTAKTISKAPARKPPPGGGAPAGPHQDLVATYKGAACGFDSITVNAFTGETAVNVTFPGNPAAVFNGSFPEYSGLNKVALPVSPGTKNRLVFLTFGTNAVEMVGVDFDTKFILCTGKFTK